MNYEHTTKIHDYYHKSIFPYFSHRYMATSFDDYLKRFAELPSGKWIHDGKKIKIGRVLFVVDPAVFVEKYASQCVTYNAPSRPEEGLQRAIYQLSPTLHMEIGLWLWIEHEALQSYATVLVCYNDEAEYLKFIDDIYPLRRQGNTEDKPIKTGFAGFLQNS